jgi:hypothetical protein
MYCEDAYKYWQKNESNEQDASRVPWGNDDTRDGNKNF